MPVFSLVVDVWQEDDRSYSAMAPWLDKPLNALTWEALYELLRESYRAASARER